jgi:epsilon-lactone hydrolase
MRESILARLARFTVRSCLKPALQPTFPVPMQRHWVNIATRTLSVPFGLRFSQSSLGGVPTEIVRSKSNARSVGAVLFLHGGAFMIGSPVSHRSITGRLAKRTGATIFAPDYRLTGTPIPSGAG